MTSPEPKAKSVRSTPPAGFDSFAALAMLLGVFAVFDAWNYATQMPGIDFYQFWVAGQVIAGPVFADVYSETADRERGEEYFRKSLILPVRSRQRRVAAERRRFETYSTPFLYTLFGLAASGDYERDYTRYQFVCLVTTVLSIIVLCKCLDYPTAAIPLAIVVLMVWFEPFRSDVRVGNVAQIQLGTLAGFVWLQRQAKLPYRHAIAGLVLGLSVAFKPNTAPIAVFLCVTWLLNGRLRKLSSTLAGAAVAALIAFFVSNAAFGSASCWSQWLSKLSRLSTSDGVIEVAMGNYSLARILDEQTGFRELTGFRTEIPLVLVLSSAAVACLWKTRRTSSAIAEHASSSKTMSERELHEDMLAIGIGAAVTLLVSQLAWLHYFLLLIPLILFLLRPATRKATRSRPAQRAPLFVPLAAVVLLSNLPAFVAYKFEADYLVATSASLATLLLFGLGLRELFFLPTEHGDQ